LTPDRTITTRKGRFELRDEIEDGPTDDFYGKAEHVWTVVDTDTGKTVARFEGSDYGDRWAGVAGVSFSEDGRSLIVDKGKSKRKKVVGLPE
jgi:hypothetical protein